MESSRRAWFYEIRSSSKAVLKRDGGFATQDAAKIAGRARAKELISSANAPRGQDILSVDATEEKE
jgi:hypothetical protein